MKKKDLIAKRRDLSNQTWSYEKIFLIFDLGGLGFTVEREKSQVGLILSISWFSLFK